MVKFKCVYVFIINVFFGVTASAADLNFNIHPNSEDLPRLPAGFNVPGRTSGGFNPGVITIDPPASPCDRPEDLDPFGETVEPSDPCSQKLPDLKPSCGGGDCVPPAKQRFFYFPKAQ